MLVKILGTAAGGAYPQWNCNCSVCAEQRRKYNLSNGSTAESHSGNRLHACLAISASEKQWFLVNATPDIARQIESFPPLHPGPGVRETALAGILLTDAELDHTIGLLILREGARHQVFATDVVMETLSTHFPVINLLSSYSSLQWAPIKIDEPFWLDDQRIKVETFVLADKPPRYARQDVHEIKRFGWVVAYKFSDCQTGGTVVVAPQISAIDEKLLAWFSDADYLFIDGTCAYNDDLRRAGIDGKSSIEMGHLPIFGENGIAYCLSARIENRIAVDEKPNYANDKAIAHDAKAKSADEEAKSAYEKARSAKTFLLHINNTNPLLTDASLRDKLRSESAIEVAYDGMKIEV